MVCVAEFVAPGANSRADGAEFASWRFRCVTTLCGQPVSALPAAPSARRDLAILVRDARREAFRRHLVEKAAARPLRSDAGARIRWKNCRLRMAVCDAAARMNTEGQRLLRELFDRGNAFALEAHEDGLRGRLAINPVFDIVAFGIALAHLVVGLSDGCNELFAVHAYDGLAVLNGFLHFRWQGVEPLHGGGALLRKIQEGRKELLQF